MYAVHPGCVVYASVSSCEHIMHVHLNKHSVLDMWEALRISCWSAVILLYTVYCVYCVILGKVYYYTPCGGTYIVPYTVQGMVNYPNVLNNPIRQ